MRRIYLVGALFLAGCANVVGPFRHREPVRVDDPCRPINEQQRLGRDRLALPDESRNVAPPSGVELPGRYDR